MFLWDGDEDLIAFLLFLDVGQCVFGKRRVETDWSGRASSGKDKCADHKTLKIDIVYILSPCVLNLKLSNEKMIKPNKGAFIF